MDLSTEDLSFTAPSVLDGEIEEFSFEGEGTTVLAFFPGAFTEPCTDELCVFRDSLKEFESIGANIIAISVDTPFSLKEFQERNKFNFRLVSDHAKQIIENYDVRTDFADIGYYGLAKRAVFVVRDREIVYHEIMDDPHNLPDMDNLKEEIEKL